MTKKLLTIIVPVYNMEEYIENSIKTVQQQTYSDLEILLIDDGSTDSSGEICDRLADKDKRIRVFHQKNQGSMRARDLGISEASGEYITFFDSDDWVDPTMYEDLIKKMGKADLVTSGALREEPNGRISTLIDGFPEGIYEGENVKAILQRAVFDFEKMEPQPLRPDLWNKVYRTEIMKKIKPYEEYSPRNGQDLLLLYRYLIHCETIVITHNCYYHYHYRPNSTVHSKREKLLIDLNHVYLGIKNEIEIVGDKYDYLKQVQKWIAQWVCGAFGTKMGFEKESLPIMFVPDICELVGKDVVLYGAGNCGISYYNYINRYNIFRRINNDLNNRENDDSFFVNIVGWIDRNVENVMNVEIRKLEYLQQIEYDLVVVCVVEKSVADEIIKDLLSRGVAREKIYWSYVMSVL